MAADADLLALLLAELLRRREAINALDEQTVLEIHINPSMRRVWIQEHSPPRAVPPDDRAA